jgi:hypothetical protein
MRTLKLMILSAAAAASFSLGAVAQADVGSNSTEATNKAVYEGKDSQGRIVQFTVLDPNVATFTRVSTTTAHYPELHWSARIGTGTAASIER